MDPLTNYILPIGGMEIGIHQYQFKVDDYFLSHCGGSPYTSADVGVNINIDRRQSLYVLDVSLSGLTSCSCDRCTVAIQLPIEIDHQVILKFQEGMEAKSTDDVIYLEPGQKNFSVVNLLYDLFVLAIPIMKVYDCDKDENPPCDFDVLDRLEQDSKDEQKDGPSIWDDIRKELG